MIRVASLSKRYQTIERTNLTKLDIDGTIFNEKKTIRYRLTDKKLIIENFTLKKIKE